MKKKLLFVIPGLEAGGAEKSLVNLLNTIDSGRFSVDLFLFSNQGLFVDQVPDFVHILQKNKELVWFQKSLLSSLFALLFQGRFTLMVHRFLYFWKNRTINNSGVAEQYSWENFRPAFKTLDTNYYAAIGFLEKSSIYFVVDQVKAQKKIGFIHTFFSELKLDVGFEEKYISKLASVAVVSNECGEDFKNVFPHVAQKVKVIPNIVSSELIENLSVKEAVSMEQNSIISIGRLITLKGFDLAVEAGKILKQKKISFHWYIIGEGAERENLETLIEKHGLQNHFSLVGLKKNPYPYIKNATVFVQPSRYEGKSIAVDEAKILQKPIVLTNFSTAKDQITNGINGQIVEMNPAGIAEGIIKYFDDQNFTDKIIANLQSENYDTEKVIDQFYQIIND